MPTLIFIDTNIFLDFYRRNMDELKRDLGRIEEHKDSIITSVQLEMEYKRNRQRALLRLFNTVLDATPKGPKSSETPAVLQNSRAAKALETAFKKHKKRHNELKNRIGVMLADPAKDPLFRGLNKLFKHKGDLNLHREHPKRHDIRELARKRWHLGYPPRKPNDTSMGDAIHWEWVVECAKRRDDHNIVIVSRDHDFGVENGGESYLNDWLSQEYYERVGKKRKIYLTTLLTKGFARLGIAVSPEEEETEQIIAEQSAAAQFALTEQPDQALAVARATGPRLFHPIFHPIFDPISSPSFSTGLDPRIRLRLSKKGQSRDEDED